MRYVLGVNIYNKDTKESNEYLAIFGSTGYPCIKTVSTIDWNLTEEKTVETLVFESAEDAKEKASELAKAHRRDDVRDESKKWQKSHRIIRFYPIKIDNHKFPFLVQETDEKTRKGRTIYMFKRKGS